MSCSVHSKQSSNSLEKFSKSPAWLARHCACYGITRHSTVPHMRARKYRVASNDTVLSTTRYGTHVRLSRIISCRYTVVIADFTVSPYSKGKVVGVPPILSSYYLPPTGQMCAGCWETKSTKAGVKWNRTKAPFPARCALLR